MPTTLVVDTGMDIVGVYCVEDKTYIAYRGRTIPQGIKRVQSADEVVTYNGELYDLRQLGRLDGLPEELPISGRHTDMRAVYWDPILGSDLRSTYAWHFDSCPLFADTYEGSAERDCHMTFKLWELWKLGRIAR